MSALKSNFRALYLYETTKLEEPWKLLLPQLASISVEELMEKIGRTSLLVSGVYVNHRQFTFEDMANEISGPISPFLLVLYGLVISVVNGRVHRYLRELTQKEWIPWLCTAVVENEPVFVLACRRSLKSIVEWMVGRMDEQNDWRPLSCQDSRGDAPLHLAIRRHQWDWAKWLLLKGASPFVKNKDGHSPLMLTSPHYEKLDMFAQALEAQENKDWFDALHDALVFGRTDPEWCRHLLDRGADVNQVELYDAPASCLEIFVKHGMDMNLGPLPENVTRDTLKLFYMYGRKPVHWDRVIDAFDDYQWPKFLRAFHLDGIQMPTFQELYKTNVMSRQYVTKITKDIIDNF